MNDSSPKYLTRAVPALVALISGLLALTACAILGGTRIMAVILFGCTLVGAAGSRLVMIMRWVRVVSEGSATS